MSSSRSLLRLTLPLLALGLVLSAPGCAADESPTDGATVDEEPLTSVSSSDVEAAQRTSLSGFTYDSLTPTTTKIMRAARWWMGQQDRESRYPRPRMCASNVSKVLFLSEMTQFDQEGVRALIGDVRTNGGRVLKMPQDPASFVTKLNTLAGGALPAGTLVAGMNINSSAPGDQHVGFVGHTDPDGTVWIYHNNWYRPANENGARKPFMVSDANLRRGFERQWMATPWVRLTRDASGKVTKAVALMPAIDDMDPFNPTFQVTLAILPQVAAELDAGQTSGGDATTFASRSCEVSSSDGSGNVRAEASSASTLLATLSNGATVTAKAKNGAWYTVELTTNGRAVSGFMHQSVLTKAPCGANP